MSSPPGILHPESVSSALSLISPYIHRTPLQTSSLLNSWLGHQVIFKVEGYQRTGSFKARGAYHAVLRQMSSLNPPKHVIAFSSGNHSQATALACRTLGLPCTVCMPKITSPLKIQATKSYGAEVIITETRQEAEDICQSFADSGSFFLHPYDNDDIIAGQGTACLEALDDLAFIPDAIFATCGGGGWLAGTLLATRLFAQNVPVFGCEPAMANDASCSWSRGSIVGFDSSPMTVADGARTLRVAERTFQYLRQLSGFFEVSEDRILYWVQWLSHLIKCPVEPTAAVAMEGAFQWLATNKSPKKILVLLSGSNIDAATFADIYSHNRLSDPPVLSSDLIG